MEFQTLNNGIKIPVLGFGVWQIFDQKECQKAVEDALSVGYRLIDTASLYRNEEAVGRAIKASGIPREDIFLTSKAWISQLGYEDTKLALKETLRKLDTDYLDLYLIHQPFGDLHGAWRAMIELKHEELIRAIGVSNFKPHHLEALMKTEVKPMVNQIEFHPGFMQEETVKYCRDNGILVEAWSPLGTGRMLTNPDLQEVASHYGKSVAQICIRWCIQHDVLPLPKSVTPSRIEENSNVFDFEINAEDMQRIDALENFGGSGLDPDEVDF